MDMTWLNRLAGRFVVFDGPDGAGKSSQFRRMAELVRGHGVAVCEVREPGGTRIGEQIREVLLSRANEAMDVRCELLLYMASRAQLVAQRVEPALEEGQFVLADRFVSSTLAYQGTAGGMDPQEILDVARVACGPVWPDLVVIFDVDEQTASRRLNPLLDRMEAKGVEFHRRVRAGYLQQAADHPDRYVVIDSTPDEETVFNNLLAELRTFAESARAR